VKYQATAYFWENQKAFNISVEIDSQRFETVESAKSTCLLGALMLLEGVILLAHGLRLGLGPFPFYGDVSACLILGTGILILSRAVRS